MLRLRCRDCGTGLNFVDQLASAMLSSQQERCPDCRREVKRLLLWFRSSLQTITAQGRLDPQDWEELVAMAQEAGLHMQEALQFVRPDAIALLDIALKETERYEVLSQGIEQYIAFLIKELSLPPEEITGQLAHLQRLNKITNIKRGIFGPIRTKTRLHTDEVPYMEVRANYHLVHTAKEIRYLDGRLLATNRYLYFLSEEEKGDMTIPWKNVLNVQAFTEMIYIEVTHGKGIGYYEVDDPILVQSYLETLMEKERRLPVVGTRGKSLCSLPAEVRDGVWLRDKGRCVECGANEHLACLDFTTIIPITQGGTTEVHNIQLLCRTCSQEKKIRSY